MFRPHLFAVTPWEGPVLSVFSGSACTFLGLSHSYRETLAFLKMMNLSENILRLVFLVSLEHHHCRWRPSPALPVTTKPITSFILREDSAVSTAYSASHFRPVIMAGCALFTSGSTESRSIWKRRALPNLNSPTSDFEGNFSFVDELYNDTLVKDLGTSNHFYISNGYRRRLWTRRHEFKSWT